MKKLHLPEDIRAFGKIFQSNGYSCYLVGGAVRNMVLRQSPTDYDFATDAAPEQVMNLFKSVIPTGIKHGTVTVLFRGHKLEVTTFRVEGAYSNARHPDHIVFTPSLSEDLKRRDFTINSMAVHPEKGELIDPHDGRKDLKKGLIRAIGNPVERFQEDGLRLMRACRFAAQLDFTIEARTHDAMKSTVRTIEHVSSERIRDELLKMLLADRPSIGIHVMNETGLLSKTIPELARCHGLPQGGIHAFDVFHHSLLACDGVPAVKPLVRLAALFHDLGKAETASGSVEEGFTFYRHEIIGEELCRRIMRRLRFSRDDENRVCLLVRHHMFHYQDEWSDGAVRRFISRVGVDHIEDLFDLRLGDQYGMQGREVNRDTLASLRTRIDQVLRERDATSIKDLAVNGNILYTEGNIPKGPDMGTVLEYLLEAVMDDPSLNTEEKLLELAQNFYQNYIVRRSNDRSDEIVPKGN